VGKGKKKQGGPFRALSEGGWGLGSRMGEKKNARGLFTRQGGKKTRGGGSLGKKEMAGILKGQKKKPQTKGGEGEKLKLRQNVKGAEDIRERLHT